MTHVLVQYVDDDILHVIKLQNISQSEGTNCLAKYHNGKHYEAKILQRGTLSEMRSYKSKLTKGLSVSAVNDIRNINVKTKSGGRSKKKSINESLRKKSNPLLDRKFAPTCQDIILKSFTDELDEQRDAEDSLSRKFIDIEERNISTQTLSDESNAQQTCLITSNVQKYNTELSQLPHNITIPEKRVEEEEHRTDLYVQQNCLVKAQIETVQGSNSALPKVIEKLPGLTTVECEIMENGEEQDVEDYLRTKSSECLLHSESCNHPDTSALPKNVQTSKSGTKKYFCVFCKKLLAKLPRHFMHLHPNETKVQQFMALPKGSVERKYILEKLRLSGTYLFNSDASYNDGSLIVARRPTENKKRNPEHYIPCSKCRNYYSRLTIYRHFQKCNTFNNNNRKSREIQTSGRRLLRRIHWKANAVMANKICPILQPGSISETIRFDELIVIFGNKLTCKYRQSYLMYHIRQILRTLARFLLTIKSLNPDISDLKSVYEPRYYDLVLQAVNVLAKLNPKTSEYEVPSLATRLGTYIKKCGNLLLTEYIKHSQFEKRELVKNFLKVHAEDYGPYVNKTALDTQIRLKRNKPINLPIHEDIKRLHDFLNNQIKKFACHLKSSFSYNTWIRLLKCLLTTVQLFNRKRAGEIERLLISDYENRQCINKDKHSDLYDSLSALEKCLAERYVKIELRGKLGRSVPILLNFEQVALIDLILLNRQNAQVHPQNPYVFGCPGSGDKFLRACICLKEFSVQCGAKHPEHLRGTRLRKQIATVVQILNLKESELGQLANFMGHDLQIHKDHYRLPSTAVQIGQLSKLLIMMESGNMNDHRGKNLQEINILGDTSVNSPSIVHLAKRRLIEYEETNSNNEGEQLFHTPIKYHKSIDSIAIKHRSNDEIDNPETRKKKKIKRLAPVSPIGKIKRVTWSSPEKQAARRYFCSYLQNGFLPSGMECAKIIKNEPALKFRTVNQLKAWVNNQIKRKLQY